MGNEPQNFNREEEQKILAEILKYTKRTHTYMKWQFIIMIALVVIPLFAALFLIPFALKSLTSVYGGGLL